MTSRYLENQNTKSPVIDALAVSLASDEFWGQIFWCATNGVGPFFDHFGKAEIDHFDVADRIQKQVLRFKIAIEDLLVVEIPAAAHSTS